jgi:hypothetical protein
MFNIVLEAHKQYKSMYNDGEGFFFYDPEDNKKDSLFNEENREFYDEIMNSLSIPETADKAKFKSIAEKYLEEFFKNKKKEFRVIYLL